MRAALEAEGWQVLEADTVKRGLVEAGTRQPDLVMLDLGLPDGDGVELIRDVRGWSRVPIIVLSARIDEADKIAALDAGADDYLTKPFGVGRTAGAGARQPAAAARGRRTATTRPSRCSASATSRSISRARLVRRAGAKCT